MDISITFFTFDCSSTLSERDVTKDMIEGDCVFVCRSKPGLKPGAGVVITAGEAIGLWWVSFASLAG